MKKTSNITIIGIVSLLFICLVGCSIKADVDWNKIDWSASVNTSLSLPIGSMSAKFGDFLGTSQFTQITVDEQGRYVFLDTIKYENVYHPIDLSEYVSTTSSRWDIAEQMYQLKDQLTEIYPWLGQITTIPLPITLPAGIAFDLEFPVDIDLSKLNIDYRYQRVDSVIVNLAQFTSLYTLENINFNWNDIKTIQLIFNENIRHKGGDTLNLPLEGKNFGEPMLIDINDFHLILMKEPTAESGPENIIDSMQMKIRFRIETTQPLTIDENQYIGYSFTLNFLDFNAMFGYFEASNLMHSMLEETPISEIWDGWKLFDGWVLPINEPSIKLTVDHSLAVPMAIHLKHFYTASATGEKRYMTFDDSYTQSEKVFHLPTQIAVTDPLDKRATDSIILNFTPANGNIDALFSIHPDKIAYDFDVATDTTTTMQQFRITNNTNINLTAALNIPFSFNENVHISYTDTIHNVNLTQLQLDSLLSEAQIIKEINEAQLQLYIVVENAIPFNIESKLTMYNANHEIVQLNAMQESYIQLSIDYPETITNGIATSPSVNTLPIATISTDDFDALASVKYIVFNASLGDNPDAVKLTPEASLRLTLGVTANIDAVIDLEEIIQ